MRRLFIYLLLPAVIFLAGACSIHFPSAWDIDEDNNSYYVVLKAEPDDAEVVLDGKLIGLAYEFADSKTALHLYSRNHELVIKKKGFQEEVVNLYKYGSTFFTVRVVLTPEKRFSYTPNGGKKEIPEKETVPAPPTPPTAKVEPVQEPPATQSPEMEKTPKGKIVNVTLSVLPKEASIYLNGKFLGISPADGKIENLRLEAGKYTLDVIKPGFKPVTKTIDVKEADLTLAIQLEKN